MKSPLPLLRCLALVLGLLILLAPARSQAQALRGTFAAGSYHSLSIHADGTLWATGDNSAGQLGIPITTAKTSAWVQVGTATDWVQVAADQYHSLGLRADGALYAWGSNRYGQLGNTTNLGLLNGYTLVPNPTPTRVGTERYIQIAVGQNHSLGLRADGSLWGWGYNDYGQLGNSTNNQSNNGNPTPVRVGTNLYTQVAAGGSHSLALRQDGTLWAWGVNHYGELGRPTVTYSPTPMQVGTDLYLQVVAGSDHSLGLRADGALFAWGANHYGELGTSKYIGYDNPNPTPVRVGTALYTQVAAGQGHSLGLQADGTLWAWGSNTYGELGNTTNSGIDIGNPVPTQVGTERYTQVAAGSDHSLGLRPDGSLSAWGRNQQGQLGNATNVGSITPNTTPTATGSALPTRSTAAGSNFGLAVKADGTLWAWGDNTYGQLGDGTTTASLRPKQVGTDRDWVQVAAGQFFGLGLKADGALYAWGSNEAGQLGNAPNNGTKTPNPTPTRVGTDLYTQVAAGYGHSLGLRADGTLFAWGDNLYGQVGSAPTSGPKPPGFTPTQVGTERYTQVAAGFSHSLGLRPDGTLWAWGYNASGQLGNGSSNALNATPTQVGTDLYKQAVAGGSHSLGLRPDGALYAWGNNETGQLGNATNTGIGSITPNPTPTRVGADVYRQAAAGSFHSLGLRPDGTLHTWGWNNAGQLGQGTTSGNAANPTPTQEATAGSGWATLAPGPASASSLVRTASGLAFASAGYNNAGQLGDGTTTNANRFDRQSPLASLQPLPVLAAGAAGPGLSLYPNPAPGHATALHGAAPGSAVRVLDALGRPVATATADAAGTAALSGLPAGLYLVRSGQQALRLVVQ